MRRQTGSRGFTLVEVLAACGVAAVLAALALPSYRQQILHARRHDAAAALTRVQAAQERLRAHAGLYSSDFGALRVPARSDQGFYALAVELTGPEAYRARATPAEADPECPEVWLDVKQGFATAGPSRRCWGR